MIFAIRRTPVFQPLAVALLVASAFPLQSFSQTVEEQTLQPVVVTATRTPQKATDVLSDTVVITSEEITRSGQTNLLDLLQMKRGIEISRNGGAGTVSDVYLRGANANQLVLLIDGVRSVSSTAGSPDWSAVPLPQIDHVEIVLGPLGTVYGADAVGGVIQVFTKKGNGSPRVTFSAGSGSDGEQVYSGGVSGSAGTEHVFRYSVQASHEKTDGFSATLPHAAFGYNPDDDGYSKKSIGGRFSLQLADGQEVGINFLNSRNNAQYDGGPSSFNTHSLSAVNTYSAYSRNQVGDRWTSLLQLSRSYTNLRDYSEFGYSRIDSTQDQISWQNDLRLDEMNALQMIAEHRNENVNSTNTGLNRDRTNDALSAAYRFKNGSHTVNVGLRYDDNTDYGAHTTGSLGYGHAFSKTWQAHASIGTSFRAPTYADLYPSWGGLVDNKPEKGKNAEIGIAYDDGVASFNATYYRNRVKDLLVFENICPIAGMGGAGCTTNVDEAILEGLSLAAGFRLDSSWNLHASLDLQNPRNKETDAVLDRRARYHGDVGMDYLAGPWTFGGNVTFSGKRFDTNGVNRLGGYTLLNLHVSYDLTKDWQVFARWNNVFDKFYELAYGYQTPGSNAFLGVRYGFN